MLYLVNSYVQCSSSCGVRRPLISLLGQCFDPQWDSTRARGGTGGALGPSSALCIFLNVCVALVHAHAAHPRYERRFLCSIVWMHTRDGAWSSRAIVRKSRSSIQLNLSCPHAAAQQLSTPFFLSCIFYFILFYFIEQQ